MEQLSISIDLIHSVRRMHRTHSSDTAPSSHPSRSRHSPNEEKNATDAESLPKKSNAGLEQVAVPRSLLSESPAQHSSVAPAPADSSSSGALHVWRSPVYTAPPSIAFTAVEVREPQDQTSLFACGGRAVAGKNGARNPEGSAAPDEEERDAPTRGTSQRGAEAEHNSPTSAHSAGVAAVRSPDGKEEQKSLPLPQSPSSEFALGSPRYESSEAGGAVAPALAVVSEPVPDQDFSLPRSSPVVQPHRSPLQGLFPSETTTERTAAANPGAASALTEGSPRRSTVESAEPAGRQTPLHANQTLTRWTSIETVPRRTGLGRIFRCCTGASSVEVAEPTPSADVTAARESAAAPCDVQSSSGPERSISVPLPFAEENSFMSFHTDSSPNLDFGTTGFKSVERDVQGSVEPPTQLEPQQMSALPEMSEMREWTPSPPQEREEVWAARTSPAPVWLQERRERELAQRQESRNALSPPPADPCPSLAPHCCTEQESGVPVASVPSTPDPIPVEASERVQEYERSITAVSQSETERSCSLILISPAVQNSLTEEVKGIADVSRSPRHLEREPEPEEEADLVTDVQPEPASDGSSDRLSSTVTPAQSGVPVEPARAETVCSVPNAGSPLANTEAVQRKTTPVPSESSEAGSAVPSSEGRGQTLPPPPPEHRSSIKKTETDEREEVFSIAGGSPSSVSAIVKGSDTDSEGSLVEFTVDSREVLLQRPQYPVIHHQHDWTTDDDEGGFGRPPHLSGNDGDGQSRPILVAAYREPVADAFPRPPLPVMSRDPYSDVDAAFLEDGSPLR